MTLDIRNLKIGVVGLGYVGLPLAVEFGKKYPTVGFDVNPARIAELEALLEKNGVQDGRWAKLTVERTGLVE